MKLPEPMSWNRAEARKGKFNGKFILGVMTTGIYCLPSCAARPPKPQNVRLFTTEAGAKAAGLRACKRCRPDLYYKGEDENVALFQGLSSRVSMAPENFADASALAKEAGVSLTKLGDLFRDHAHLAPASWLRRMRVKRAATELLGGRDKVAEIGFGAGFESESVFHRQFLSQMRMTPGAYRALDGAEVFLLHLPVGYRAQEILAYHARDPQSLSERSEGSRIWKALHTEDGPAVLEISIEPGQAWVRVHADGKLGQGSMAVLHGAALKILALTHDVSQFETRHAEFVKSRRAFPKKVDQINIAIITWLSGAIRCVYMFEVTAFIRRNFRRIKMDLGKNFFPGWEVVHAGFPRMTNEGQPFPLRVPKLIIILM